MEIRVAETAGFCFGVDRAVKKVYELLNDGKRVASLGPIVHNPQIISDIEKRGVVLVSSPQDVPEGYILVIRAHGIAKEVEQRIIELGISYVDCTCPFVKKIHRIAQEQGHGKVFVFFGDSAHPETLGVIGHTEGEHYVVKNENALKELIKNNPEIAEKPVIGAAQTTFSTKEWEICLKTLKKLCTNSLVFDTICNATEKRQAEAMLLARSSDAVIVIGGRNSSNTSKLRDICSQYCTAYLVESVSELPRIGKNMKVGITAGASTPAKAIKEVLAVMANQNQTMEQNFEEMLEESLKGFNTDERVHGVVVGITPTEVYVDVGRKQAGFIPASEMSNDPDVRLEDIVKLGDEFELLIMKTNDQEGTIMLSKRRIDAMKGWDDIAAAQESAEILTGKVIEVVRGGVIVLRNEMRIFVPASQATAARGDDLNELTGKEVKFRIIETNRQRRRAIGSIRSVLREERRAQKEKFWEDVAEGAQFVGKVKSLTNFGAFVDLGPVDGMVHISELSWNRVRHPSEVISVGDTVNVFVKSLDRDKGKISLGYKRMEDNPWEVLRNTYEAGSICDVKIVGLTQFGAFATLIPGIDGLIHISQIADKRIERPHDVLKVGDTVKVKITEIDYENHRVSLSIRALLEQEQAKKDEQAAESPEEQVVYVAQAETEEQPEAETTTAETPARE